MLWGLQYNRFTGRKAGNICRYLICGKIKENVIFLHKKIKVNEENIFRCLYTMQTI